MRPDHARDLTKILFLDIETVPQVYRWNELDERTARLFAEKTRYGQGKSVTQIQKEFAESRTPFPFPLLKIGPSWDREKLKERIDLRTKKMIESGLIEEVRGLQDEGLETWAPMSSVGYKETLSYLRNGISRDVLQEEIAKNTRQLAKRQRHGFSVIKTFIGLMGRGAFLKLKPWSRNF